jgi:hypothetical protein
MRCGHLPGAVDGPGIRDPERHERTDVIRAGRYLFRRVADSIHKGHVLTRLVQKLRAARQRKKSPVGCGRGSSMQNTVVPISAARAEKIGRVADRLNDFYVRGYVRGLRGEPRPCPIEATPAIARILTCGWQAGTRRRRALAP